MKRYVKNIFKLMILTGSLLAIAAYAEQGAVILNENESVENFNFPIKESATINIKLSTERIVDKNNLEYLSNHPQWKHLLFYKNGKPEVISDGFYLSISSDKPNSEFSPYNELIQTLKEIDNKDVYCKFPARYFWLSHHLKSLTVDLDSCPTLPDSTQSISLLLISNYLKNPASSFGHVLVKTKKNDDQISYKSGSSFNSPISSEDLLNDTYNFGAKIPENENGAMYALKGLFGFYDAGFTATEFFKQDSVYSKKEQRDMWEYVLNLNEFQTRLLNYHLYEAKSARFNYYFIKQNCGYRSGEILELVSDIKITDRIGPWYAPDYVFNQLEEYSATADSPLVASVRYLPSEQTQLHQKFLQLPSSVQKIVNDVISLSPKDPKLALEKLDALSGEKKILALDFLILHQTYKSSQKESPENKSYKKQLISARLMLPESDALSKLAIIDKPSPAMSNKTTQTQFIISDDTAKLGLSLFVKDPLNRYTSINKKFEAIKTSVDFNIKGSLNKSNVKLSEFVFVDMQQIENLAQPLAGEPKLSWQLKAGARTDPINGNRHRPYVKAGVGGGAMIGNNIVGYALANATLNDQHDKVDGSIEVGVRAKKDTRAIELSHNYIKRIGSDSTSITELTMRQQLNKNDDVRLQLRHIGNNNLNNENESDVSLAWHHYW